MSMHIARDDNANPTLGINGMRPDFTHAVSITTGVSITEQSLSTLLIAANMNVSGQTIISITAIANSIYFSLGPAGTLPGSNGPMGILPAGATIFLKAQQTDASLYHQQITGAATVKVLAWA